MGIENTGPWKNTEKPSEEKMKGNFEKLLHDSKKGKEMVDQTFGKKEKIVQVTSGELSQMKIDMIGSNEEPIQSVEDVKNVNEFLANLSEQTKDTLGKLRFEGMA